MEVYITGVGAVSPLGMTARESFSAAVAGKNGISSPEQFSADVTQIFAAGQVKDFTPEPYVNKREAKRMARFTQMAIVAAAQAWEEAGLKPEDYDPERVGVVLGSGMGGLDVICEQHSELVNNGPRSVSSFFIPKAIVNTTAGLIAIRYGLNGPCYSIVTACASGADAIGHAYYAVREGRADAMLVGGAESVMIELAVQGFHQMGALTESDDITRASIPFDKERQGFVIGEGAAFLLLESEKSVRKRSGKPLGSLAGYAQTCDAHHITAPQPEGKQAARAMAEAMRDAGISGEQVGYINAHGTSTPLNDATESAAIEACFGEHAKALKVSSTKSMTGHMLGAAGAFEAVLSLLALNEGIAPPTIGLEEEDEVCRLNYVKGKAQKISSDYALSNSFGFGGHNSCLVLKRGGR
ncbi:MAG: beta-ketoacyl-ACP synthase II [Eubacteriales bacterium]|jgi:3-oxoacyl-[acyl-carrier-protein] synthase II|nr:beta-ketoacyl-ACP synthase II [Eubacteriales bacterium]